MNPLYGAAQDLALATANLLSEIRKLPDAPSKQQIKTVRNTINKVQHQLNRIQTEADSWADLRQAS